MPLFSSKNNTISDKKMANLQQRARAAQKDSMFSKRQIEGRRRSEDQRKKSRWS